MTYKPSWDLSTVPDDLIIAEAGRRRAAMRTERNGGRPVTNMTPAAGIKRRKYLERVKAAKLASGEIQHQQD